ncbi:MAG: hypothetical protein V1897_02760 [Pseudomonadota bacterium]
MKGTAKKIDLSDLTMAEKRVIELCLSDKCVHDFETCPCDNRKGSSKYCDNFNRMVKVYGNISQPGLFV